MLIIENIVMQPEQLQEKDKVLKGQLTIIPQ
jgi:hypothetical protein